MKVLTLGNGFVADHLPYEKITERLISNTSYMDQTLSDYKPDILVNCIGKTGRPNVDWCEAHKSETYMANVIIPLMIAKWCEKNDVHLINIGSGCVYFGESPNYQLNWQNRDNPHLEESCDRIDIGWKEADFANPGSFYSKTKYACDMILGEMPHVTTLRIRMPVSTKDNQRNLIHKLKGYKQIINIPNSMTFMDDLVRCVEWASNNKSGGIFHVVNPQPVTAVQIMKEYQKYVPEHKFDIINESELDQITIAKRSNCILSTEKLSNAGFKMTNSVEALEKCMSQYVANVRRNNVK